MRLYLLIVLFVIPCLLGVLWPRVAWSWLLAIGPATFVTFWRRLR